MAKAPTISTTSATSHTTKLMVLIDAWSQRVVLTPEFNAFKRQQMLYALYHDDPIQPVQPSAEAEFKFDPDVAAQHDLVMSFFSLHSAEMSLKQCEYYFRRYPFGNLPVSRADHMRNICEMYFNHFYMIKMRLKNTLNKLNNMYPKLKLQIGAVIKKYDKGFDQELRARNGVHHHTSFDEVVLDQILITGLIAETEDGAKKGWVRENRAAYRKMSAEWAARAKRRSRDVDPFVEAVANALIKFGVFLQPPEPQPGPEASAP